MIEKDVIFKDHTGEYEAVMIAEEDVGISIIDKKDKEIYYLCQRGPLDPKYGYYPGCGEEWAETWDTAMKAVETGLFDDEALWERIKDTLPGSIKVGISGPDVCSFSQ